MTDGMHAEPALDELPQSLRQMAQVIGLTPALTLARHFGGVRLYVPQTMTPDHVIARLIGFPAALRLAAEYGGQQHFWIPRAHAPALRVLLEQRNAEIRARKRAGASFRELSMDYALSERQIQTICKDVDDAPQPQRALF